MTCQKAGDLLSAYMDGELAGRQGESLKTHLDGCAGCREELETLKSAVALLEAPKAFARPEGLLEEFKAKYLPEAEAASEAPRWGFRLPALPKMEWPSLGRVLMPMGGMAAAAAALLVALHSQSPQTAIGPGVSNGPAQTVAAVPDAATATEERATTAGRKLVAPAAPKSRDEVKPRAGLANSPASRPVERPRVAPPVAEREPVRPSRARRHLPILASVPPQERLAVRRPSSVRLTAGKQYASNTGEPALSKTQLNAVAAHPSATPTLEDQFADIAIVSRRKAAAATVEEGYAEVSCKNLATGKVKSMAVGIPAEPSPIAAAAGPAAADERTDGTGTEADR